MTRIERLPVLTSAAVQVLQQRARDHARAIPHGYDAEQRIQSIGAALAARQIRAACQFDDSGMPCGFAAWRVRPLESATLRALVIVLYTVPDSPPTFGAALVEHVFHDLRLSENLVMIEARLRDESPGVRAAWLARGCVIFEHCRMVHPLADVTLPPLPRHYDFIRWDPDHHAGIRAVAERAHADNVETVVLPDPTGARLAVERWLPGVSYVALHHHREIVGYIALEQTGPQARVLDHAVHPAHRGKGIGRALLRYSLAQCRESGLAAVAVGLSARNPAIRLYVGAGFAPDSCGDVAIWWLDGRQRAWRG